MTMVDEILFEMGGRSIADVGGEIVFGLVDWVCRLWEERLKLIVRVRFASVFIFLILIQPWVFCLVFKKWENIVRVETC